MPLSKCRGKKINDQSILDGMSSSAAFVRAPDSTVFLLAMKVPVELKAGGEGDESPEIAALILVASRGTMQAREAWPVRNPRFAIRIES